MATIREIIQHRSQFIDSFELGHRVQVNLLEEVYRLGRSMAKNLPDDPAKYTLFQDLLAIALVRTVNRLESILILLRVGNPVECAILLRSIFDDLINVLYIEKNPGLRTLLFARQEVNDYLRFLRRRVQKDAAEQARYTTEMQDYVGKVSEYDKEISKISPGFKIPKGKDWSGKNIREMAEAAGLAEGYDHMYWELSGITHSLATSSKYFVRADHRGRFQPVFYPHDEPSKWLAEFAALHSLFILNTVDKNIGAGKARAINQLKKRIQRITLLTQN